MQYVLSLINPINMNANRQINQGEEETATSMERVSQLKTFGKKRKWIY